MHTKRVSGQLCYLRSSETNDMVEVIVALSVLQNLTGRSVCLSVCLSAFL